MSRTKLECCENAEQWRIKCERAEAERDAWKARRDAWKNECYRRIAICYGKPGTATVDDAWQGSVDEVAARLQQKEQTA